MAVDLGDILPGLGVTTTSNSTGALADPTTLTLTLTKPDGTMLAGTYPAAPGDTLTIARASTGTYSATVVTTAAGRWTARWVATGNSTDGAHEQAWTVEDPTLAFVDVGDAVAHLRASGIITATADLEQLRWLCLTSCDAVERDLGRVLAPRTFIEAYSGGYGQDTVLTLLRSPVISVTTVVEDGVTLTSADWTLDVSRGRLHRGTWASPRRWPAGLQNVSVTYRAGYAVIPPVARKVALNVVERCWQASQQAPHEALDVEGEAFTSAASLTEVERSAYRRLRRVRVG